MEKETAGKPHRESKIQFEETKLERASSLLKMLESKEQAMIEKLKQTQNHETQAKLQLVKAILKIQNRNKNFNERSTFTNSMSSSGNTVAGNGINPKDRYFQADFDQEATFDPSKN